MAAEKTVSSRVQLDLTCVLIFLTHQGEPRTDGQNLRVIFEMPNKKMKEKMYFEEPTSHQIHQ